MGSKLAKFAKAHLPFAIATVGEFIALYFWLYYFDKQQYALATFLLFAGFLVERVAVLYWVKVNFGSNIGIAADSKPVWQKALGITWICLTEITVWVLFVWVYDSFGFWPAFAVVFVGEQLEHSYELGLLSETSMKKYLFSWDATWITILEAFGGIFWLYLVRNGQPQLGGLFLLTGLSIEHVVQGNAIKRKLQGQSNEPNTPPPDESGEPESQPTP